MDETDTVTDRQTTSVPAGANLGSPIGGDPGSDSPEPVGSGGSRLVLCLVSVCFWIWF